MYDRLRVYRAYRSTAELHARGVERVELSTYRFTRARPHRDASVGRRVTTLPGLRVATSRRLPWKEDHARRGVRGGSNPLPPGSHPGAQTTTLHAPESRGRSTADTARFEQQLPMGLVKESMAMPELEPLFEPCRSIEIDAMRERPRTARAPRTEARRPTDMKKPPADSRGRLEIGQISRTDDYRLAGALFPSGACPKRPSRPLLWMRQFIVRNE